jgi:hypothetical protein
MRKIFGGLILCMAMAANGQTYNKELAEAGHRIRAACLASIAPDGGKVQKNLFIYDVAKEHCLCVSDAVLEERSILSGESTSEKEHRFMQISLQCKDRVFNKREPAALAGFNKGLASRNLPPVSRFPWHYWFD